MFLAFDYNFLISFREESMETPWYFMKLLTWVVNPSAQMNTLELERLLNSVLVIGLEAVLEIMTLVALKASEM